jgi:hypothetical protein
LILPCWNLQRLFQDLSNIISDICHKNTKSTIWIGGDLNIPDINWSSKNLTSNQYRKEINEFFLNAAIRWSVCRYHNE